MEEAMHRRGLEAFSILSPNPTPRPKRAIRALVRFDGTIGKVNRKKDKGKGRQI
jgi:hypothetical protein